MRTSRTSGSTAPCPTTWPLSKIRLIIGIDPGSRVTGYGLIQGDEEGRMSCLAAGRIKPTASWPLSRRLKTVYDGLLEVLDQYQPHEMAVEDVFFARNVRSALALGHVRGVALLVAATRGLPVHDYSPRTIKKALVGYGQASKEQVSHMVRSLLSLEAGLGPDETDALACAICHLHTSATLNRMGLGGGR